MKTAEGLRHQDPQGGMMALYHGGAEASTKSLGSKGISTVGLDDGLFNVAVDPQVAVRYAKRYGGTSPSVAKLLIPDELFQQLFRDGMIVRHPVLPNSFQITPEGIAIVNKALGK